MARRQLALPPTAIDRWCQYVQGDVRHIVEATGFVNFELRYDGEQQRRTIGPQHYIITFPNKDKGRSRCHASLLTLRLVPEDSLPEQVQIGVEVRGRGGESVVCAGEYIEFELLSSVNDASKQPPLRIATGPVRVNAASQQREFMRIDLGRCVRQIVTDIVEDTRHKGQKLVRSRWWVCVEVLRLVCGANALDCSALDSADAPPLEWVICLADERAGSPPPEERSIDELAKYIDGGGKRSKARSRRKKEEPEAQPLPRPVPPPGWSRTIDLASGLVDAWREAAGCEVRHSAESTGFVHFLLSFSGGRRCVEPAHYVIAFPASGRYHSALLALTAEAESLGFELLSREGEVTPLRFTAGPVRVNEKTGQREAMSLDLADCIRWAPPDFVEGSVNGTVQRLMRQRWWISVDTLRLICSANSLDCAALDSPAATPLEWVACLVDSRTLANSRAADLGQHDANTTPCTGGRSADLGEQLRRFADVVPAPEAEKPKAKQKAKNDGEPKQPSPAASASAPTPAAAEPPQPTPEESRRPPPTAAGKPPPPARTLALPTVLIDSWCQFARKSISHVAEASGFVHFELSFDAERRSRTVVPEHYIIAFPRHEKGRQRYLSSLLSMRVVNEAEIPPEHAVVRAESGAEYVEFELLLRMHEAPAQQQLRITAGPVRANPETGQRESMRIDLGRCVREIASEVVDDPRGKRLLRSRWWICLDTLRLVCTANGLDCSGLDEPSKPAVEWVICLADERQQPNEAPEEERPIDELVSFISGSPKGKKKKRKDKEASAPELQLQAAARLLAEAAASCTSPQQAAAAAAAAEAARKAAEVPPEPAAGALEGIAGLEALLAGLRSEFVEECPAALLRGGVLS